MQKVKRLAALLLVLLTTVGCDQATKAIAQTHLSNAAPQPFLNGLFWLHYAENPGAFLSLGAAMPDYVQRWVFTIAVSLVLIGLLSYALRELPRIPMTVMVALALFIGGGTGNLIDRLTNDGRVIDFMHIGIGYLRTGIFNVADMALMAGVFLFGIYSYHTRSLPPSPNVDNLN